MIAVVIVNYRTPDMTLAAIRSLAGERGFVPDLRVFVIDNASGDNSAEVLGTALAADEFADWVTLLPQGINGGFGWGNNQAVLQMAQAGTSAEFVMFLNPDTEVQPGAIAALAEALRAHPTCGIAGATLTGPDGYAGASAFRAPTVGREFVRASHLARLGYMLGIEATHIDGGGAADWVSGAAFMARWSVLDQVGLFDDGFFLYFEEIELMARVRAAGWTVRAVPDARIMHREGGATGMAGGSGLLPTYWHRSRRRYFDVVLGKGGADRADRAFHWGAVIGRLRGRGSADMAENLKRMADAAVLMVVPPHVPRIGDAPGLPPAWMRET
jgi:N-acetylglucosaminyl-diphospho-decaprenol L-rhamnosyltransferase